MARTTQVPNRVGKSALLDTLGVDFRNIARTARAIEITEHGFAVPYRVPTGVTESVVLTHADALLHRLESTAQNTADQLAEKTALRAKFAAYELGEGFVAELRTHRDALKDVKQSNQAETQGGVESTAELTALLDDGRDVMLHLDAVMHNKYRGVPQKPREWQSASHVEKAARRAKTETQPLPAPVLIAA